MAWSVMAATLMMVAAAAPVRQTASGPIIGVMADDIAVFRGIPYAAPPVGDRRWRPPAAPWRWGAPRTATTFGAICPQPPPNGDAGVGSEAQSEDCLTLNIWQPREAGDKAGLPVMMWFHGGGYVTGSGSAPLYDGSALARRGVVVVTFNYRLGRLGFFGHARLNSPTANFGLLDQVAALRWVKHNIARFGGDPAKVTVFGNNAGGKSILFLMVAPEARGLFRAAIVQSGLGGRKLSADGAPDRDIAPGMSTDALRRHRQVKPCGFAVLARRAIADG